MCANLNPLCARGLSLKMSENRAKCPIFRRRLLVVITARIRKMAAMSAHKKWITGFFIAVFVLPAGQMGFSANIDAIDDLQKLRTKVCEELAGGDDKSIIKALKETGDFLEKQAKKSDDPEFTRRSFTPATRKLELIYESERIRKPQVNYISDVYRAALAALRVRYRDEIRRQILVEKNSKPDFFENDCKKLKK